MPPPLTSPAIASQVSQVIRASTIAENEVCYAPSAHPGSIPVPALVPYVCVLARLVGAAG
jgi:hypothetical protein